MYEIVYSPIVQEKLAVLKAKLIELCGEKTGKKRFLTVLNGLEVRLSFSNTGIKLTFWRSGRTYCGFSLSLCPEGGVEG